MFKGMDNESYISLHPMCWSQGEEQGEITGMALILNRLLLLGSPSGTKQLHVIYDIY